ncbi:MAG TPA: hypothetical protein VFH95_08130 [Candidatus Kapabacteria bacterium]|nr:hypothetical protein [Candidatus Kapabacteria bacterium]
MWFLITLLFILWAIGYITFGSRAYWVDILLVASIALIVRNLLHRRRKSSNEISGAE